MSSMKSESHSGPFSNATCSKPFVQVPFVQVFTVVSKHAVSETSLPPDLISHCFTVNEVHTPAGQTRVVS